MSTQLTTHSLPPIAFILNVTIWISPSDVDEFFSHFKPAYDAVMNEEECVYFVVGQNPKVPGEIWWSEGWTKDVEWFGKEQITKEYYKPYSEATTKMYIKERQFEILLPEGEKGMMKFKTGAGVSASADV